VDCSQLNRQFYYLRVVDAYCEVLDLTDLNLLRDWNTFSHNDGVALASLIHKFYHHREVRCEIGETHDPHNVDAGSCIISS